MRTLLTIAEVKKYSRRKNIPTCSLEDICEIEEYEFDRCKILGVELKEALLENLKDYSNAQPYDPSKSYVTGEVIIFNGYYLEAVKDSPGEPTCNTDWRSPDKFENECYNKLWCDKGLARYLSLKVIISSTVQMTVDFNGNGVVKSRGSDFVSVDKDHLALVVNDLKAKANRAYMMMSKYIKDNDDGCFESETKSCGCLVDTECDCSPMNTKTWYLS